MSRQSSTDLGDRQPELFSSGQFAARLRHERARMSLTQTDFGRIAGVGLQTQSRYEKGETRPNAEYLSALAAAGVDIHYVLTGERIACESRDRGAASLLGDYLSLPSQMQAVARRIVAAMVDEVKAQDEQTGAKPAR